MRLHQVLSFFVLFLCINCVSVLNFGKDSIVLHNPSSYEAMSFVRQDKTNEHSYSDNYTCWNFASDFKHNAFEHGLLCGLVYVRYIGNSCHTIVCFNCTDRTSLLFIEPQNDFIVTLDSMPDGSTWLEGSPVLYVTIVW